MSVKKLFLILLVIFVSGCVCSTAPRLSPRKIAQVSNAEDAGQLILVGATGNSDATLSFYAKAGGEWKEVFSTHAYIGKNGLGKTREGDGKTPEGVFHFTKAFGIAPDPGCALGYVQVDDSHYWIGDSASPRYNQFVSTRDYDGFSKKDSEHIIEYAKPYQYCLNISYNEEGIPDAGSAIFLHCYSNNPYTGGCVAIPEQDMKHLMQIVRPGCKIVISSLEKLEKY
ncbi:MAG: L,D-transpeptidase family protein [Desulfovibrionaceae bacterium]|nr:L,D-transpeptidase family protein [Desulfovibrionaceae bacterium]